MNRTCLLITIVFASLAGFWACATVPTETDIRAALTDSVRVYWELRMKDKYEEAYQMEYREKLLPFNEYVNRAMAIKKFNILSYTIKDMSISGDKGEVKLEFIFSLPMTPKPFSQILPDEWIYENRKWMHRMKD